ncbi:MAG: GH25 family lysozyme [Lachnospiraceae bacterium]|nr:GH25 family lysozyme [Lachnospiraceae bacterium]MDY5520531.1 GH25 family lysozyme [Agathobacter sp.]
MFSGKYRNVIGGVILTAALAVLPVGIERVQAVQVKDGVMGQSIEDETVYDTSEQDLDTVLSDIIARNTFSLLRAAASYDDYIAEAWTTEGDYTDATYYHRSEFANCDLINGIDVSWWQGGGKGSTKSNVNWEQAHDAGIDYVFVRVASRDTTDGSIYEDTSADAHIQGALENDINVGLYVFSQALTVKEAEEEADYVLELLDQYGWDVTMPIVMDREAGSYKRLTAGKLSKTKETNICTAFSNVISDAGYTPMVYASASWFVNYIDQASLEENGCKIWLARYNNSTDKQVNSTLTYEKLSAINYEFWQYSSAGKVSGYSGKIDVDFWYKDTSAKTEDLTATANAVGSVTLEWSEADDAHMYRLYRFDPEKNKYVAIQSTADTSYTDTDLTPGETYQYKVRCYWTIGGTNYYGTYSDVLEATTLPAKVETITADSCTATTITLSWDEIYGATGYRIYQYNPDSAKFEKLTDVSADMTSFKVAGLASAKEQQFKVRAYKTLGGTNYWGTNSSAFAAVTKPAKVKNTVVETASSTSVDISWDKVSRATGYQIYRLDPETGSYTKLATIKNNKTFAYTDTALTSTTEYTYKVRAYLTYDGSNYYGGFGDVTSATTKPAKVKNLKATTKSSSVKLSWDKQSRGTGYQVYRLNSKTGKYEKIATIKDPKTVSYTDKAVKKGTTYSYKVRAYKTYNGTNYYGSYSGVIKIKAK